MSSNTEEKDIYRRLQLHLDKMPIGFPATRSGSDIRLLKHLFSPEEAEVAMFLKFGWDRDLETLDTIYERVKNKVSSKEDLEQKLDSIAKKGLIMFKREDAVKFYGNALLMVGIFEFQVNNLDKLPKEFIKDFHEYIDEGWLKETFRVKGAQLRTIPVEESIDVEQIITDYDNIKKLIETTEGPYMVTNCICRQVKDIMESPCEITSRRELCLGFGYGAKIYIEQGWGREITKEESLDILKQNQEDGLVLQPDNSQELCFICSCCSCCCESLSRYIKLPNPGHITVSNYYAKVDSESCTGCETCIEICPMKAIIMEDNISQVIQKRCIGCGNCIVKCPSEAIELVKKERQFTPFPTMDDLFDKLKQRKKILQEENSKT
ncbi:MAG: 4Fe-4S binding protein [Candidatus Hermodarchaeota archaeon]